MSIFGDQAHGIFAQSASRSGDADTSGAVTIAVNDDLTVKGAAGHAILAQSEGSLRVNNGTIGITVAEAAIVSSAPGSAETIALRDGKDNMITNNGSLMHLGGPDATVIATDGSAGLTVLNNGFLEGSVAALGTDLTNADGASFALGTTVGLGSDGTFLNNGRVSPGGLGPIATSTISAGSFEQSATGVIHVDVTYPAASDLIVLSGDEPGAEAKLAGMVQPSPIAGLPEGGNSGLPKSGTSGEFAILTTEGRPIDAAALTVANTSTVDYDLSQGTLDENPALFLDFKVDYSPWNGSDVTLAKVPGAVREAVDSNHTGFARHIDELIDLREQDRAATGDQYAFIDDLVLQFLRMEDPAELLDTYERYVAGEVFASSNAALFSSTRFADQLNSCPSLSKEGVAVFRAEGECAWARIGSATTERQSGSHETGYDEDAFGISGGFQAEIAPNWFGGFALGDERSDLDNDRFASEADRFQAGAVIKRTFGTTTAAVSVSGGFSDISGSREVVVPSGMAIAESDPDLWWIAGHTRLSHDVTLGGGFSLTPMVDLGIEHQRQDGYTETGAGAFGLEVGDIKQTFFTVNPTVEVTGSATPLGVDGAFSARAGLLAIAGDTERTTELRLAGVGGAGPSFTVRDDVDPLYGSLGASVNARLSERTTLEASIDALLGDDQQTYSGGLRLNIAF